MLQHSEPADAQLVGKRADCVGQSANCAALSTLLSPYPGRSTPIIRTPAAVSSPASGGSWTCGGRPSTAPRLGPRYSLSDTCNRVIAMLTAGPADGNVIVAENARPPIDGGTVLITGASAGIGREFALQLAPRARMLILLARRAGRLDELRTSLLARHAQLRVLTLPVDLSDESDVDRALAEAGEQAGPVDVLVNNAGVGQQALADQADWARVRTVLRTNVLAVAQLTTALLPAMVDRRRGGVLNMGSGAGLTVMPAAAAYSASKYFMDGFSEALRADLTGTGVVVTQVCPGPVDSEFDQIADRRAG
jgi:short-subunit dehydrogenase